MFPPVKRPIAALIAALIALGAASCGTGSASSPTAAADAVDLENGQKLFQATCGGCHTLQNAGSKGTIGPDLDAVYREPALEGWERSSFEATVLEQIELGSPESDPAMPAELLTGQDARDVAAYVAAVAAQQ